MFDPVPADGAPAAQPFAAVLPQPANWVPFKADVEIRRLVGGVVDGRLFRRSDGSTRLETWYRDEPARTLVSINNVAHVRR